MTDATQTALFVVWALACWTMAALLIGPLVGRWLRTVRRKRSRRIG